MHHSKPKWQQSETRNRQWLPSSLIMAFKLFLNGLAGGFSSIYGSTRQSLALFISTMVSFFFGFYPKLQWFLLHEIMLVLIDYVCAGFCNFDSDFFLGCFWFFEGIEGDS